MKTTRTPLDKPDSRRRLALHGAAATFLGSLSAALAGCGGGGDSAAGDAGVAALNAGGRQEALSGVGGGGTGRARAFVSAVVDSTNPLTVNGVRFDTSASHITDADGQVFDARDILPGMTSQIEADTFRDGGATPQARALTVQLGEQLLGPVDGVTAVSSSFTALGQTVVVTAQTVLDAALASGVAGIQAGMVVKVWGQLDPAGGRIVATRLELAAGASVFVVRGVLTALDRATGHAAIGTLQVVFAAADGSVVAPDVIVGAVVRARLLAAPTGPLPTLLTLRGDALRLPDHVAAEIEGRVTRIESSRRFDVDGVPVDATSAASVHGLASLALGARVEVHGRSRHGVLMATDVTVEPDEPVELEGTISAADLAQRTFVLRGVTVVWSGRTIVKGGTTSMLTSRRHVGVVGRWNADRSRVEATRIHVEG